ncbi:MAG: Uncharacterized protein XD63_0096 [Thermoanaerobacterales bacterium 50_218]|nr:MAG: Uncharacterized protein XD63_0096 [Thermoanaerobacterales bacterium 50_218]HAA90339.1 DUF1015 domain-containing protein [Peptococcaceae bacterium]
MAKVIPFRGIRYNKEKIGNLAAVVTPPYDVIDSKAQKMYYERHPYNVIRLELGYQYPTDDEHNNRYTRAAKFYQEWLHEGILKHEDEEAFYLYEQEFVANGQTFKRTGFFARVQLEDYSSGKILPHEATLAKPKADRLALMRACKANFSSVFSIYNDPKATLEEDFEEIKKSPPEIELEDDVGEKHRLWVITNQELHRKITSTLENHVLYIADGHHRYDTALTFYREVGEKYKGAAYVLMYLVNIHDPGLVILPTHRIIRGLQDLNLELLKERLTENFVIEPISARPEELKKILGERQKKGQTAFVMATREPATYLLTLKNPEAVKKMAPDKPPAWCELDVSVLHLLILKQFLGIDTEKPGHQAKLEYTRDEKEAFEALLQGEGQLVFILNPTKIEDVVAVATAGEKMPQKSTYFYPKLLTGLVLNDLTI